MLREGRWFQLEHHTPRPIAYRRVGVLQPREHGFRELRDQVDLPDNLDHIRADLPLGVPAPADHCVDVLRERSLLQFL